jgi:THAP4-like, heme-binding beta-barrel domain
MSARARNDHEASDVTDLRAGEPLHDALLALLPLVGAWTGTGVGVVPSTGEGFAFRQQLSFAHDGRPFLVYESRTWLVDGDGKDIRPAFRESGFWRPGAGPDDVEVVVATITGLTLLFTGTAGDQRWDLATSCVVSAPTAKQVAGERRLYAISGDTLAYATELALRGDDYAPHLNATLKRM